MNTPTFCTKFDHRYLDRGLALYDSLQRLVPGCQFHVLALSGECAKFLEAAGLPHLHVVTTEDLCRLEPRLEVCKSDRNKASFVFTQTPFLVLHALQSTIAGGCLTYIDADTYFFSSPEAVIAGAGDYDTCLTRHNFAAHWEPTDLFGEFNTGWVGFRHTRGGVACAEWWAERCLEWCHDRPEGGKFGDQKYLEGFLDQPARVAILDTPGVNCAPWNASNRRFARRSCRTYVDGQELVHFHFSLMERIGSFCVAPRFEQQLVRNSPGLARYVYSPYSRKLRAAVNHFGVPKTFLRPRKQTTREMHSDFHHRDIDLSAWRVLRRVLAGEYVLG